MIQIIEKNCAEIVGGAPSRRIESCIKAVKKIRREDAPPTKAPATGSHNKLNVELGSVDIRLKTSV